MYIWTPLIVSESELTAIRIKVSLSRWGVVRAFQKAKIHGTILDYLEKFEKCSPEVRDQMAKQLYIDNIGVIAERDDFYAYLRESEGL